MRYCSILLAAAVTLGLVLLSDHQVSYAQVSSGLSLHREWQVSLGAASPRGRYQATACPDGRVYWVDGSGRLVLITPRGAIAYDGTQPDIADATAIACGDGNRLYASVTSRTQGGRVSSVSLVVLVPHAWGEFVSHIFTAPELRSTFSMVAGDGLLCMLGGGGSITTVTERGQPMGELATTPDPPGQIYNGANGVLVWDPLGRQVVLATGVKRYRLESFEITGPRTRVFQPYDADFRIAPPTQGYAGPDDVIGAARMSNGLVATHVVKYRWQQSSAGYLELFNQDLTRVIATNIQATNQEGAFGILIGASPDSGLYFQMASPLGAKVTKAGLRNRQ